MGAGASLGTSDGCSGDEELSISKVKHAGVAPIDRRNSGDNTNDNNAQSVKTTHKC